MISKGQNESARSAHAISRIDALEARLRSVPSRWGAPASSTTYKTLAVIGGNAALIGNSLEGIQYRATLAALTQAYDPDVDTVYPQGLGYGRLYIDGQVQAGNVLIRHSLAAYPAPVLGGRLARVCGTTPLTYSPGGASPDVTMTAYIFNWL